MLSPLSPYLLHATEMRKQIFAFALLVNKAKIALVFLEIEN